MNLFLLKGFDLIGLLVEEISQIPFSEFTYGFILDPLEIGATGIYTARWYLAEVDLVSSDCPTSIGLSIMKYREIFKSRI